MDVSILGGDPDRTRIAVDGARINDSVDGGTQQNFSQEIVQEFQISSVNFDLSTGITAAGAINIVTRSGSNQFHGSGFFFFRDHHMAAYPGLQRDPLAPDPFFARRQSGLWVGGPVVKDRLFFFAAYEHNNQHGVFTSVPTDPAFSSLARVTASPKHDNLANARLDYRISAANTAFVRFSHDGNNTFAPREVNSMPSAWESNINWADSGVFSLISTPPPHPGQRIPLFQHLLEQSQRAAHRGPVPRLSRTRRPARHRRRRRRGLRQPDQFPAEPPRPPQYLRR